MGSVTRERVVRRGVLRVGELQEKWREGLRYEGNSGMCVPEGVGWCSFVCYPFQGKPLMNPVVCVPSAVESSLSRSVLERVSSDLSERPKG